ncbi:MAG: hypothetical protein IID49_08105 [Proteobacteria bacterium]|nr:hypothetical protein [Pseudomonadota bacterium]
MASDDVVLGPIADGAIKKIATLADQYKKYGYSAFTVAAGVALILFTFVIAAQTDPSNPESTFWNFSTKEEIVFLSAGLILVVLGGINLVVKSILIHRLDVLGIQVRIESIRAGTENLKLLQETTDALNKVNRLLAESKQTELPEG